MDHAFDDIFKAMADPGRRQMLAALCHSPRDAGQLARLVGLAPNAVSFHLKTLRTAGLITSRRHGKNLRYQLNQGALSSWISTVGHAFTGPSATNETPPTEADQRWRPDQSPGDSDQLPSELL